MSLSSGTESHLLSTAYEITTFVDLQGHLSLIVATETH